MARTVLKAHVVSPVLLVRTAKMAKMVPKAHAVLLVKTVKTVLKVPVALPALLVRTDKMAKMVLKALAV